MRATQLCNLGRRSVKFSASLLVILPQTVTALCASMPAASALRTFVRYLIAFLSRLETVSDIIFGRFVRPAIPDMSVKFRDPRLNRSPEIRPEAIGGGIFDRFSTLRKCRPEAAGDVMSCPVWL